MKKWIHKTISISWKIIALILLLFIAVIAYCLSIAGTAYGQTSPNTTVPPLPTTEMPKIGSSTNVPTKIAYIYSREVVVRFQTRASLTDTNWNDILVYKPIEKQGFYRIVIEK
jgi:hypothetical protein